MARIGRGLEMQALGVDLVRRHPDVEYVEPSEAFRRADILVCAMNLTPDNAGYFRRSTWEQVRPGAIFMPFCAWRTGSGPALLATVERMPMPCAGLPSLPLLLTDSTMKRPQPLPMY